MKKSYIKPVATSVAFVVNENIATSSFDFETSLGNVKLWADWEGCNEKFPGVDIPTGLEPGNNNVVEAVKNLSKEELKIIYDMLLSGQLPMNYN